MFYVVSVTLSSNDIWSYSEAAASMLQLVSKMNAVDFFTTMQPLDFRNKNIENLLQLSGKRLTTSFSFFVSGRLSTNL